MSNKTENTLAFGKLTLRIDLRNIQIGLTKVAVAYIDDGRFALILEKPKESIKKGGIIIAGEPSI